MKLIVVDFWTTLKCPVCSSPMRATVPAVSGPYAGKLNCACTFSAGLVEFLGLQANPNQDERK